MPLNMVIALVAVFVALAAYSVGVWGAFRAKGASTRHVTLLWVGVVFDILATAGMAYSAWKTTGRLLEASLHTYLALAVFFGMTAVAAVSTWARMRGTDAVRASIAKWATVPWAAWVAMFIWGFERSPRG